MSRLAYELVLDERDRLRTEHDKLVDTMVALQRKSFGMKEQPQQRKSQDPEWMTEEMPPEVLELISGWSSEQMRAAVEIDIRNARRQGTPWDELIRLMTSESEDELYSPT